MLLRATRLGRSAMQHIELVSKEQDFSMQRSPRPEDSRPDQPAKIAHQNEVSTDSQTIVSRFQFAVGTGKQHHVTSSVTETPSTATFLLAAFMRWAFVTGRLRHDRRGKTDMRSD